MCSVRILMLLITYQDMDKTTFASRELAHLKFLCFVLEERKRKKKESQRMREQKKLPIERQNLLPAHWRI